MLCLTMHNTWVHNCCLNSGHLFILLCILGYFQHLIKSFTDYIIKSLFLIIETRRISLSASVLRISSFVCVWFQAPQCKAWSGWKQHKSESCTADWRQQLISQKLNYRCTSDFRVWLQLSFFSFSCLSFLNENGACVLLWLLMEVSK